MPEPILMIEDALLKNIQNQNQDIFDSIQKQYGCSDKYPGQFNFTSLIDDDMALRVEEVIKEIGLA